MGPLFIVAGAQDASDYFRQNCTMCHTIGGGRLIGPDLGGVTKRKDRAWLVQFLQGPKAMIDSGDPYAVQLVAEADGLVMPTPSGMTPSLADALLTYFDASPAAATSQAGGGAPKESPFTAEDITLGKRIFLGQRALVNGGPACVSCHSLGSLGSFGGGNLGPDLTNELDRLGGRRGAAAWLTAPPTTTMQAVFSKHALEREEILPILAEIEDASRENGPQSNVKRLQFSGFGLGGMLISLVVLQVAWRRRLGSVRRSVIRARVRGEQ